MQRFWWRAFEGPPHAGAAAVTPPPRAARGTAPASQGRAAKPAFVRPPIALQIPRGERRYRGPRRSARQRWARPMLAAGMLIFVAGAAAVAVRTDRLKYMDIGVGLESRAGELMIASGFGIDQVNVSGQHYASDSDIFDALDLPNVRTFAAFDSDAALTRIERIPWIDKAQITRVYPGTLDIAVRERVPAFIWSRGGTNYLVDATGRILGPASTASRWALPSVIGEGANTEASLMLAALRQYPAIEHEYAYAERIAERRWRVVLKNGTALELGADREIEGLEEIANTIALAPALKGPPMIVDLRTPGRIATRPLDDRLGKTALLGAPVGRNR